MEVGSVVVVSRVLAHKRTWGFGHAVRWRCRMLQRWQLGIGWPFGPRMQGLKGGFGWGLRWFFCLWFSSAKVGVCWRFVVLVWMGEDENSC